MDPVRYQSWLIAGGSTGEIDGPNKAEKVFEQFGCVFRHVLDPSRGVARRYTNVFGKPVELDDGRTVLADGNMFESRFSIQNAEIVKKGYHRDILYRSSRARSARNRCSS